MDENKTLEVILITGQSGVGKTTVAFEIAATLEAHSIGHALIDTDELDRIYPTPSEPEKLSERALRSVWDGFAELGCSKLILCAVLPDATELPSWIKKALPDNKRVQMFRLQASDRTVEKRLRKREIGSLLEKHLESTRRAKRLIEETKVVATDIHTDDRPVSDIANEILQQAKWI